MRYLLEHFGQHALAEPEHRIDVGEVIHHAGKNESSRLLHGPTAGEVLEIDAVTDATDFRGWNQALEVILLPSRADDRVAESAGDSPFVAQEPASFRSVQPAHWGTATLRVLLPFQ